MFCLSLLHENLSLRCILHHWGIEKLCHLPIKDFGKFSFVWLAAKQEHGNKKTTKKKERKKGKKKKISAIYETVQIVYF